MDLYRSFFFVPCHISDIFIGSKLCMKASFKRISEFNNTYQYNSWFCYMQSNKKNEICKCIFVHKHLNNNVYLFRKKTDVILNSETYELITYTTNKSHRFLTLDRHKNTCFVRSNPFPYTFSQYGITNKHKYAL